MSVRKPVSDWTSDFDHLNPEWTQNPYPIWEELRKKCPVAHTERFDGVFFPTRYEDIRTVAYDTEHFSSRRIIIREGRPPVPPSPPITSDPPEHSAQKAMLLPAFALKAIERYAPQTRAICRALIDRLRDKTHCDGAVDYAQEVPVRVIASMLGVSERDGERFRRWDHEFLESGVTDLVAFRRATDEVEEYFLIEIAKRRIAPGDDLITYILNARIDGQPLSDDAAVGTLRLLLLAGIDTTWSMIGSCLWHLATHPDDRKRLVAEPGLIPTAIEEFLRAYAPATLAREVVKETQIGGCPFKEGEMTLLSFPAANRDPAVFPEPDRVILDRTPNPHVAFGIGIHRCLGSNLARMELTIALEEWLGRFPEFALAPGAAVTWSQGQVRGPRRLPFVLGPVE
jgi:cytochrome P450